jgi:hypothetical protein
MVSLIALLIIIVIAYIVVVSGAMAYEITGLDRETARFQALSAFTGTGFTTRKSQLVVSHPVRRHITSLLIILGYAGTATVIASFVSTLTQATVGQGLVRILIMAVCAAALWYLLQRFGTLVLRDRIRRILAPRLSPDLVLHEELLTYGKGFGITRVELAEDSQVVGKALRELDLRQWKLQLLAVEATDGVHPIPDPDWVFVSREHLVLYGDLHNVQKAFGPRE